MALWQFKFYLVPTERIDDRTEVTIEEFEDDNWWADRQPSNCLDECSHILPPMESWHDDLSCFGTDAGNKIEVWREKSDIRTVQARIDCRDIDAGYVQSVLTLASIWRASLLCHRYQKVLPTDLESLLQRIGSSPNLQFMLDPKKWLPKLADEVARKENDT